MRRKSFTKRRAGHNAAKLCTTAPDGSRERSAACPKRVAIQLRFRRGSPVASRPRPRGGSPDGRRRRSSGGGSTSRERAGLGVLQRPGGRWSGRATPAIKRCCARRDSNTRPSDPEFDGRDKTPRSQIPVASGLATRHQELIPCAAVLFRPRGQVGKRAHTPVRRGYDGKEIGHREVGVLRKVSSANRVA